MRVCFESFRVLTTAIIFVSLNLSFAGLAAGNDIVATEDVVAGSSVFVFRGSKKRPQEAGAASGRSGGIKRSYQAKVKGQVSQAQNRKAAQAKARKEALAKARAKERLARLKLSNNLAEAGETKLETGDIDGAIKDFRASLNANPKNADASAGLSDALTVKGIQASDAGNSDEAVTLLNEAAKRDPKNAIAFLKLGEIHGAGGRKELAAVNYEKAITIDPELSTAYLPAALAYGELGQHEKAEALFVKAEAADPTNVDILIARAQFLSDRGKAAEAVALIDKAAAAEPANPAVHYVRGLALTRSGQAPAAIEAFKRAGQLDAGFAAAWIELGVLYYNAGDYRSALTAYLSAVRVDGNNAKLRYQLASTYRQLERYPEANVEYAIAAKTITDDPNLYSEWGYCLGKASQWENATARLEKAKEISPTAEDESNVGWAYYNGAQADKAAKNDAAANEKLEKGKQSLESAVQKDPNLDAAHMNLGSTYNSLGEHDKAVIALNEAVRLHNDWAIALNQLGLAYRGSNNLPLALAQFNRVVALDGNNVSGLFNLGSTQHAAGDKKGAKATQARLKKIRPDLADQLGNIIAGKAIEFGTQKLKQKLRIPGFPY